MITVVTKVLAVKVEVKHNFKLLKYKLSRKEIINTAEEPINASRS